MTTFSNVAPVSGAITIASLSTLGSGAYSAPSSLIDNTPSDPAGVSYLRGQVRLSFSAALTAGAGLPYITLFILKAADGTNLPKPPGTSAASPALNQHQLIRQLVASTAFQIVDFPALDLDPFQYAFQINNNSGVAFSGTATLTLYRWNLQGV